MQVAEDVFCFTGTDVNFALLREGSDLTLVDGGYPGDFGAIEAAVRSLGARLEDIRAMLITHAHADHLGAAAPLHERCRTPLLTDPAETPFARREQLEQVTPRQLAANLGRPGMLGWTGRIIRAGALRDAAAPHARAFEPGGPLDLPGHPVPVATHGHSSGHTAYHLPSAGVVITGDALVTGHALSRTIGPQLLPEFFNHDERATVKALDALGDLDGDCILPGHGRVHHGSVRTAVDEVRGRAAARRDTDA